LIAILLVSFVGCSDDDDDDNNDDTTITTLSGEITENTTLEGDKEYLLSGAVFVGNGTDETVLTIEPGCKIYGEKSTTGTLIIRQNSKIMAEGTRDNPIVMTSDQEVGSRARADWGGLVINGNAPLNTGTTAEGEGGSGRYGGTDPHDNSGVLRYVRVEFAGKEFSPDNELNGIAFQGVGDATTVEYIQVHMNKDDGIEFFGGTCDIKYVLLTGNADDSFDYTDGWTGRAQYVVVQQYGDDADQGFEFDNNGDDNDAMPFSNPTIYNFTLLGDNDMDETTESDYGALIRAGSKGKFYNGIIAGFSKGGLNIDDEVTHNNADAGDLDIDYVIFADNHVDFKDDDDTWNITDYVSGRNLWEDSTTPVSDPWNLSNPNYAPTGNALSYEVKTPDDSWFDATSFLGGVDPSDDWTTGWTIHEQS
ncbi:MAG: hypothetical protein ACLFSQ_12665, partial [Candidatus Zixiibacteriota bacterium]